MLALLAENDRLWGELNEQDKRLRVRELVDRIAAVRAERDQCQDAMIRSKRSHMALSEALMPDIDLSERGLCSPAEAKAAVEAARREG